MQRKLSRRHAIKAIGAALGAGVLASLPARWLKPVVSSGVLPAHAAASLVHGTQTFSTPSNTFTSFVVPAGVTSLTLDAYGAQGGASSHGPNSAQGGHISAVVTVTPGSTLQVYVGGKGGDGTGAVGGAGGANGGGDGAGGQVNGAGGGGGWSGVKFGATVLVVAGGGGAGAGGLQPGGAGGGGTGGDGGGGIEGGHGGSQAASGEGGVGSGGGISGANGTPFQGGAGGGGTQFGGGGGGGGYYGGGGGGGDSTFVFSGGGGGGSSYAISAPITNDQGVRSGNGQVTLTW